MNGSAVAFRRLAEERLGLGASSLPDARVDEALTGLDSTGVEGLRALRSDHPAWQRLVELLVVGETSFFRQRSWFHQLVHCPIDDLIAARERGGRRLRIWSAGCASGEETYSVVIALRQRLADRKDWDWKVVGTDLCADRLATARRAQYRPWSLRECDAEESARYFRAVEDRFELLPELRANVTFTQHDLLDDAPVDPELVRGAVDLVICRNVLMYFTPQAQRDVAQRLVSHLAPGGWLAVAPVEAHAELFPTLRCVNVPSAIFFQRPAAAR